LDDTCVMCSKCFHATNHDGHDVKIWISRGAGGCCDCGDPEAWKVPMECTIHSPLSSSAIPNDPHSPLSNQQERQLEPISSIPPSIINSVRETMNVVTDYILETFATSPEDFVSSPRDVGSAVTVESIQQDCFDSHEALGLPIDLKNQSYACVLWNDEKHSFDAVINVVREAIGCTKEEASHAAECVDIYGRHIIKESTNLEELIQVAKTISSIHLAVTICSTQKTVREEIAGLLLDWLKELTNGRYKFFSQVEGGNCIIRDMICEVLSTDWELRPELASLSTRSRRTRMPEDEDDEFDLEGADEDMGDDDDDENMIFDEGEIDMEDIDEHMLLDEDEINEFFNVNENEEEEDDEEEEEDEEEEDSEEDFEDAEEMPSPTHNTSEQNSQIESPERNNEEDHAMETDHVNTEHPTQASTHEVATSSQQSVRRRESGAHSTTPASAHYVEILKKRRLSASSHSKSNKAHKPRDILDMDWSLDQWLEHTEKLESDERIIAQKLGIPYTSGNDDISATRRVNAHLKKEFRRKLRLDYLLQFDLRLWKTARISIKDLLIGTFVSNFQYRPVIGIRFARNYPELVDAFFFKDREPENSVSTLSVQLLTVPTVASMLVRDFKFFGIVCSILQNFFLTDRIHMVLPNAEGYAGAQVDCNAKAIARHRYAYTIFDLRYVMNAEPVRLEVSKNPIYLRQFVDMIYQFQAMDPLQRQTDTHVEYESQSWVAAFNMTLQTSKLCRLLAGCFDSPPSSDILNTEATRNLCRSIYRVLKAILDWDPHLAPRKEVDKSLPDNRAVIKGLAHQKFHQVATPNAGTYEVVDYDVTQNPVSFHHPFHWLLSELFENVSLLHQGVLNELGWLGGFKQMVNDAFHSKDHDMFLMVLDYPIRTLVILSQINCGVWVRNGYAIRNMVGFAFINDQNNIFLNYMFFFIVSFL
jgi:E3 ubiquitin-protein ligase UBR1